jgi:hypothetical protein
LNRLRHLQNRNQARLGDGAVKCNRWPGGMVARAIPGGAGRRWGFWWQYSLDLGDVPVGEFGARSRETASVASCGKGIGGREREVLGAQRPKPYGPQSGTPTFERLLRSLFFMTIQHLAHHTRNANMQRGKRIAARLTCPTQQAISRTQREGSRTGGPPPLLPRNAECYGDIRLCSLCLRIGISQS